MIEVCQIETPVHKFIETNGSIMTIKLNAFVREVTEDRTVFERDNVIVGKYEEFKAKRKSGISAPLDLTEAQKTWVSLYGDKKYKKSYVIQQLLRTGLERKQVADLLGIIYQHVRAAAVKIGK